MRPLHHPADRCTSGDANSKCCGDDLDRAFLHGPSRVLKKFLGGIATLFCRAARCRYAILKCIGGRGCSPRSLVRRIGKLLACLFEY